MWKSKVQYLWEEAAKKIGIKIKYIKEDNIFCDYWELDLDSKVENLEEEVPIWYKVRFFEKPKVQRKRRSCKTKFTYRKKNNYHN